MKNKNIIMIPKIIHFCWFGGNPLPPLAQECIASWRKYLPDYEIWAWVEAGLAASPESLLCDRVMEFDVNCIPYTAEAYRQRKFAFVSDYARFWAIYKYGGVYFDTDVEVIRPMEDIVSGCRLSVDGCGSYGFMGFEMDPDGENTPGRYAPRFCFSVALGLGFGMTKEHEFMKMMLDYYETLQFELPPKDISWYKTIVAYTTEQLCAIGLKNVPGIQTVGGITVYPHEYFAPINVMTGRLKITDNTRTIHRYMGSWSSGGKSIKERVRGMLPDFFFVCYNKIKRRRYRIK